MSRDLEFLIELVKDASNLITDEFEVKAKGDRGDLVTNFDYEIEQYMIDKIKSNYPDFSIVSEEYNSKEYLTDNCFVIDPIDGTANFANNIPLWGIQIACIRNNKTCAAVIYLPKLNELYYADENGSYLNNKLITVNDMHFSKGIYSIEGSGRIKKYDEIKINKFHYRCYNASSVSFAWVASGRLSATIFTSDHFWDYVPGQYIVEQAGGVTYNNVKMHIAANNEDFLKTLKEHSSVNNDEEVIITKK